MRRRLLLSIAIAIVCAACNGRKDQPVLDFDRMREQPRYDAYGRSPFFPDGSTMRQLPEGVVAVESAHGNDAVASGRADGRALTSIPVAITADVLARGQNRYEIFCRPCHDVDGAADAPVARNMQLRQPPSLLEPRIRQLPVGRIYQAIADGYGLMPSYARQLTLDERWAVTAYVRALQLRDGIALGDLPSDVQAEASRALEAGGRR